MEKLKLFIAVGGLAIIAACGQSAATNSATANNAAANNTKAAANATPAPTATVEAASGAKLYSTNCANCHKENGKGGKVTIEGKTIEPDDLTTAKMAAKSDDKLFGYVMDGFPEDGMPPFKDKLKEQEIKDIIKYLRSDIQKTGPKLVPAQP
jgi:cytochrome c6